MPRLMLSFCGVSALAVILGRCGIVIPPSTATRAVVRAAAPAPAFAPYAPIVGAVGVIGAINSAYDMCLGA
ncbi:hypothetical protein GCM10009606_19390 [Nocardioides aquiterrae]|uniref:Uncharacterized protein n=1 Tax=Nocardioides aquiterrae TaxID=203799 RepID=A0ABN1UFC7_9ACTN